MAEHLTPITERKLAVLGTGAGSLAFASDAIEAGHEVRVFSNREDRVKELEALSQIERIGPWRPGVFPLGMVSGDLHEVISGADTIFLAAPGDVQWWYLEQLVGSMTPNQLLILSPGSGGSLVARHQAKRGGHEVPTIVETVTLPYVVRRTGSSQIFVESPLRLIWSALPSSLNASLQPGIDGLFPLDRQPSVFLENVLAVILANPNPVVHALPCLLNLGTIELRSGGFSLYTEGMSRGVLNAVDAIDAERRRIGAAFGLDMMSIDETYLALGVEPFYRLPDIYASFHSSFQAVEDRYLSEDYDTGLYSMVALARVASVPTPLMDATFEVFLATRDEGHEPRLRDVEAMGLSELSSEEVIAAVT